MTKTSAAASKPPRTATSAAKAAPRTAAKRPAPASVPAEPTKGQVRPTSVDDKTVHRIPLNQIVEWPRNPRRSPDKEVVASIAASLIDEKGAQKPLLTPISVMILDPTLLAYTVYMGSQRHGAYKHNAHLGKMAGDVLVECFVDDIDEETAFTRAILENVARGDMHEMDKAEAILNLANQKMSVLEIANSVGMSKKGVQAAIDVARLDERSKALIRSNARTFAWAHTLTGADAPLRNRILDDIEQSPNSWATIAQLQGGMKMTRVNAANAIFDIEKTDVQAMDDLLDGTRWITDRDAFWQHQNAAVEEARDALERAGHDEVQILRGTCHEAHRYREDASVAAGKTAFIEVSSDGHVKIVRDLVPVEDDQDIFSSDEAFAATAEAAGESITTIAPKGKPAKILIDVLGDVAVAALDQTKTLRVLAAALIEDDEIRIAGSAGRTPAQIRLREETIVEALGDLPQRGERIELSRLPSDETALVALIHKLTLTALGPCRNRSNPFDKADEGSLLRRALADDPSELRRRWTPNKEFLEALETRDLRNLGLELLAAEEEFVPEAMSKGQLVAYLVDAFAAVEGGRSMMRPETQMALSGWRPEYLI